MRLYPTRENTDKFVEFSDALLAPAASFGGLYAPKNLPSLGGLDSLKSLSYADLCRKVFALLEVDLDAEILDEALKTYDRFDNPKNPAPIVRVSDDAFVCELWHGPTRAFKDMALQPFGAILSKLAQKRGEKYLILAATSGDTGPATLETFANREGAEVVCIYPDGGTSEVQRLQMITPDAPNLKTIAIKGDFDDAQSALKSLLASADFNAAVRESGRSLSAANSVNFGRILFQIIYHIRSYLALLERGELGRGEAIDIVVPSGNFGNALGCYYARKMGLPIAKIVIASNDNNILTDLVATGRYDILGRKLIATASPAMDILKSSNVERVLFDLFGADRTRELMESLAANGAFVLDAAEKAKFGEIFEAAWSNEREVLHAMSESAKRGYIIDPHTATCVKALRLCDSRMKVVCSTAEWTKFAPTLLRAAKGVVASDRVALNEISAKFNAPISPAIERLFTAKANAPTPIAPSEIGAEIIRWLGR